MNQIARFTEPSSIAVPGGSVEVVSRHEAMQCQHWANAFGSEAKDRRYYELVEDTIHEEFDYRYFAIRDWNGEICGIQPFFILDLDLLVGIKPRIGRLTGFIRRLWPRFMHARTLMVGCAAGEGHLDGKDEFARRSNARLLASAIVKEARGLKAGLIVLKEFPAKYRPALQCFVHNDFTRIPSLPHVRLNIDYSSFDEYMRRALSGGTRRKLRKKFRATEQAPPIKFGSLTRFVGPVWGYFAKGHGPLTTPLRSRQTASRPTPMTNAKNDMLRAVARDARHEKARRPFPPLGLTFCVSHTLSTAAIARSTPRLLATLDGQIHLPERVAV
jgi:hypothetical protein